MANLVQLKREMEEVKNAYLFRAYHETSHLEERHVGKDISFLKMRMRKMREADEMAAISAFNCSIEEALEMIYTSLVDNQSEIEEWLKAPSIAREFTYDFDEPIGFGIVKGADWNQPLNMSRLSIVLAESNVPGRLFKVITAYPIFNMDEVDDAFDAIDSYSYN